MRISRFGGGFSGYGSKDRKESRARFRRSHSVGQKVQAVFLGWEQPGLAKVVIDGCELLAGVDGELEPGSRLAFRIKELLPEIVLSELVGEGAGEFSGSPLAVAHEFLAARDSLEGLLRPLLEATTIGLGTPLERQAAFLHALTLNPGALGSWLGLTAHQVQVNSLLAAHGNARVVFLPWLLPQARNLEVLVLPQGSEKSTPRDEVEGLAQTACSFTLPEMGACQVRLMGKGNTLRFRILLSRMEHADRLAHVLATELAPHPKLLPGYLGAAPLPPGSGSLLLSYLEGASPPGGAVLNTRV
ncbi:MAG: hypothetical protein D6E12_01575 [Desulfovibrio sp.]|nr:MAG: hypothetical protein D6E12_01575 [Desulfovibrio sp.]